jgi:hypothetical protein
MRAGDGQKVTRPVVNKILISAFVLVTSLFLIAFSNHDDYNGDALNMIVPMFHLDDAKQGLLLIYRYYWQPLSYETGTAVFWATRSPTAVFLLAPVSGAITLLMLLLSAWRDRMSIGGFVASLIALFAIPEFWFSSLYFNSTILGLPFVLIAIAMLDARPGSYVCLLAGFLVSIAILMRLDFVLMCPALALVAWQRDRSLTRPFVLAFGVLIGLVLGYLLGWLDPVRALEVYHSAEAEIVEKASTPGWDLRTKLLALSVILSPMGWAILLIGGPMAVYHHIRRDPLRSCLWVLALLPLALPLVNLLTPKYALPLLSFAPPFLVECIQQIEAKIPARLQGWPLGLATVGSVFLLFVSFSFYGHPLRVEVGTLASRPIHTHSGFRSYGGYLWQAMEIGRPKMRSEELVAADELMSMILEPQGPDLVIVGGEDYFDRGGVAWRLLQLELERRGFRGEVIGSDQIRFNVNGRKLTLISEVDPSTVLRMEHEGQSHLIDLR